ncbi:MAG: serine/threonine protein kinase [Acidobacteria bacterium]|nr:serine/threonine protein kinase [Acidobacteriota bacterium]
MVAASPTGRYGSREDNRRMDKLGRYQIREMIGEGAMASVYQAYDPEIDRTLAIKVLKPHLARVEQYRARFLREARAAGVLSHPNIVTIFDVGVEGDVPYIAMELIDGMTLGDLIRSGREFTVDEVVAIGIELTRALDFAHRKGIVHRDVKPGNVMMIEDRGTVKVTDFGICQVDSRDGTELTQATRVGDVLGTPNYMSPEQVAGGKVDARSDLFSVGVVLYRLVTGVLPFEGDSVVTVAYKIAQADAPAVEKLRADVPLSLRRAIDRALKKQPEKRYQSGEEFAQALVAIARELAEERSRHGTRRGLSLGVRWALSMAVLVALTMSATAALLYTRQYTAMMDQVMDYGGSLAKFMATQNAVPLLGEDWDAIDVFIQETRSRQDFDYIRVVDHEGVVRGSSAAPELTRKYVPPAAARAIASPDSGVTVQSHRIVDGRAVLDFAAPVLFQGKEIGRVHLGIYEAPLAAVARLMLILLGVLTLVTSAAVALGTYLLARRLTGPIRVLRNSLAELAAGRYDYRIADPRSDELGQLYREFDATAAALQARHEPAAARPGAGHPPVRHDGAKADA